MTARLRVPRLQGQPRRRVLGALSQAVESHPLTLLIAPAGAGKTTALVQLAEATDRRHVWYRASPTQTRPRDLLAHLKHALGEVVNGLDVPWDDAEDAVAALARVPSPPPTLLSIDDLHELLGSDAEDTFERIVGDLPGWLRVVAGSRHTPGFNHPALRVSGQLVEITEDTLRWRPWEVEHLFRDYYRMPLRPEEAARLTQRTEGWAAGLQMFHLASRDLPLAERSRLIDGLHTRPGLVRDYLTKNVIAGLPASLRGFLIDTCVLGRLDGPLCDRLRDRDDSASMLAELEDKRLFLIPREDAHGYRYHEILRSYLEVSLLERDGPMAARGRFQRAGALLEAEGSVAEALHAYTRAEAWQEVAQLLGSDGPELARGGPAVLASLPRSLVMRDPWLRLAQARALLGDGRIRPAVTAYREAEVAFGALPAARICRDERAAVQPWLETAGRPPRTLTDLLRAATLSDPRRHARRALAHGSPAGMLTASAALLLAGGAEEARQLAVRAGSHAEAEVFTIAGSRVLEQVARLVGGVPHDAGDLLWAAETFEHLGATWLARLARALSTCRNRDGLDELVTMWELVDVQADPWARPLLRLVAGIAAVVHERPEPRWLEEAALEFRRLGAGTLAAWAQAWEALARARRGDPDPGPVAERAGALARQVQVPGAEAVAELALAVADGRQFRDAMERATALAGELGLALPVPTSATPASLEVLDSPDAPRVRCFGALDLAFGGRTVELSLLKPQSRVLLAFMALHARVPIHRDRLIEVLWPGEAPDAARRRLGVLVSTVRRHLEPETEAGRWSLLVRRGEAYLLDTPPGTYVDVRALEESAAAARHARSRRDTEAEMVAHRGVMDAYRGELLPEFGPADWLVDDREHYRVQVVRAAQSLATWQWSRGDPSGCIETARSGLRVDRYCTRLWRLVADAHRALGDVAAAARADEEHVGVLEELGIPSGRRPTRDGGDVRVGAGGEVNDG